MPYKDPEKKKEWQKNYYKDYYLKNRDKAVRVAKEYYHENKDRYSDQWKKYYAKNKDKILAWQSVYKKENKEYIKERDKKRYNSDIQFKLIKNLRCRLYKSLKKNYKSGSAVKDLGCSIEELKIYLEKQFQKGMNWNNWGRIETGKKWNIDHKIPISFYNLTDRKQLLKAVHYTNLQPLWANENNKKSDKILV